MALACLPRAPVTPSLCSFISCPHHSTFTAGLLRPACPGSSGSRGWAACLQAQLCRGRASSFPTTPARGSVLKPWQGGQLAAICASEEAGVLAAPCICVSVSLCGGACQSPSTSWPPCPPCQPHCPARTNTRGPVSKLLSSVLYHLIIPRAA